MGDQTRYRDDRVRPRPLKPNSRPLPEDAALAQLRKYEKFEQQTQQVLPSMRQVISEYDSHPPLDGYVTNMPVPQPNVWYNGSPPHPQSTHVAIEAGMSDSSKATLPQNYFLRNLLIVGLTLIILLLTGICIFLLLTRFSGPARLEETRFPERAPVGRHAELLEGLQNMSIFYYPFTSGPSTDVEQRFPPTGSLPNLDFTTLVDFNVCCTSLTQRFVCMSGGAFNHGSIFLDAIIEHNTTTDDVYLLLWVNSNDLIEVACAVRGFYLAS
jgi:hypothetical protein